MKSVSRQIVGAGSCDPSGKLSLLGALTLVEDAVTATLEQMQINGMRMRREYGAVVVFAKNHVRFLQPLLWQDKIKVLCFVSAKSVARLTVDVCVKKAGAIALYARTEVCAVDEQTGRIRRMETVGVGKQVKVVRAPYDLVWQSFEGDGKLVDTVTVRTGNIDYAGHTNNVEYIHLLLNTFTLDEWRHMAPHELQVAYLSQSFLGDNLAIYACDREVDSGIGVTNTKHERIFTVQKDTQPVLRCAVRW